MLHLVETQLNCVSTVRYRAITDMEIPFICHRIISCRDAIQLRLYGYDIGITMKPAHSLTRVVVLLSYVAKTLSAVRIPLSIQIGDSFDFYM